MTCPTLALHNASSGAAHGEVRIPVVGFGTYQLPPTETVAAVRAALDAGYRAIDTAKLYGNEREVGIAVRESTLPRAEIFVTTKLWNDDQGYDSALAAFERSFDRLGLDYVDLYLIHWPEPEKDRYVRSWRALGTLLSESRVRAIGVSNFAPDHIRRLTDETGVVPALNQVPLHPGKQQKELRRFHRKNGIATQAWAPLNRGKAFAEPTIARLAKKHAKTPAQIVLRWHLQSDIIAIPKSANAGRIRENFDIFDFALDPEDMTAIDMLDE